MTCDDALGPLHDRLDGPLPADLGGDLERHLAGCADCRALAHDLDRLRDAAGALPREVQPSRDLWPVIAARIETGSAAPSWWHRPGLLLAALVLVALGSSALTAAVLRTPAEPPPIVVTERAAEDWEEDFDLAAAELRAAVDARRAELDPATRAVVDENLRIIDQAIEETRAALADHPGDPGLRRGLAANGEQRIALLRHVLTLTPNG
jgi:anti-sigma factor RsiW